MTDVLGHFTISKTFGPWGCGLAAHDVQGHLICIVTCHPKHPARWGTSGLTTSDKKRVSDAVNETRASIVYRAQTPEGGA